MKRETDTHPTLPVHDYGLAVQRAVSWLGDRYLLATPVATRRSERRTHPRWVTAPASTAR